MDQREIWAAIEAERHSLADMLDAMPRGSDWDRPSLCAGWRIRDVAAHLALATQVGNAAALIGFIKARGSFNRMIHDSAVQYAEQPIAGIVEEIRESAYSRRLAPTTKPLDPLFDALVHGQDIAMPLGIERAMPLEPARAAATHIWERGFPFYPQRRLRGLRLIATDVDWAVGAGEVVQGPVQALLLLISGRPAALPNLSGVGTALLGSRLG